MSRTSFQIQKAVVFALFFRELNTRFGRYRLGYAWALLEPVVHVAVIAAIWTLRGRREFVGIPVAMFLLTGIIPFLFFKTTAMQCLNAVEANRALFTYKQVRPFDAVIARLVLESVIYFCTYVILLFIFFWFLGYDISISDPLRLIMVNALLYVFTLGISLTFSVYGALYPEIVKVIPLLIMRVIYITSGIIFPLFIMPTQYHDYLLWNPLLHIIEMNHMYFFSSFVSPQVSIYYVAICAITALAFGMLSYRANWVKMIST